MIQFEKTINFNSGNSLTKLPVGVYSVKKDPNGNLFLEINEDFKTIKLTGKSSKIQEFVCSHYKKTDSNFGCIFEGISGMGKTATIKNICNELNLPIILIQQGFYGQEIQTLLNNINSECILFFDEFEKIYNDRDTSNTLLSLFDGFLTSNRFITFVSFNERSELSSYFFGRPGRFLYNFKFYSLSTDDAIEFIQNNVDISEHKNKMFDYLSRINDLSYDICDKICKIISIHGIEKFIEFCHDFNVDECDTKILVEYSQNSSPLVSLKYNISDSKDPYFYIYSKLALYFSDINDSGVLGKDIQNLKIGEVITLNKKQMLQINSAFSYLKPSFLIRIEKIAFSNSYRSSFGWD